MSTVEKIRSFSKLKKGWRLGEGIEFSTEAIDWAIELAAMLGRIGIATDAFPGTDGSIRVAGYKSDHYLEFNMAGDLTTFVWE